MIDIEPWSGRIFSEKRGKLLKLAAKTMSMESSELLQRRLTLHIEELHYFIFSCCPIMVGLMT